MTVKVHDALQPLLVPLEGLSPHPRNPRNGDTEAIASSVRANGVYRPMIVQRSTGHVIAGNHLLHTLLEEGATHGPAVLVDVNDEVALRIMVADNRTSSLGREDDALLADVLRALDEQPAGLVGTGYEPEDLAALVALLDGEAPMFDGDDQAAADAQERAAWPTIKVQVDPDTWHRWQAVPAEDDTARLTGLLACWEGQQG